MYSKDDKIFYVYEWFIKDTGEIFYVGKGYGNRMYSKRRNNYFKNIYNKYECDVRIYKDNLTEDEAYEEEYNRIQCLKSIGQAKANIQNGGRGGGKGWDPRSAKTEKEIKEWNLHLKIVAKNRWKNVSPEERKRFSEKMSKVVSGKNNPFYGKHHSLEAKRKISEYLKGRKGDMCPNSKSVLLVDENNNIVKRFATKNEAIRGNWRKEFPKPHGSGTVYKCFHENIPFHELNFIYEEDYNNGKRSDR